MRLRNNNKAKDIINASEFLVNKFPIKLNGSEVLEIGAGKGKMISELALKHPKTTFYALEKYESVASKIIQKIDELNLKNLFVICEDASKITELFEGTLETIWLTFSDPWPKNRHEKRRLTHRNFLNYYTDLLSDTSVLKLKTDNDEFFRYSIETLILNDWRILNRTKDLHNSNLKNINIPTEYEKKWSTLGKNIKYLEAKKP